MKKSRVLLLLVFLGLNLFANLGYSQDNQRLLRVAVLDNLNLPEKLMLWPNYEQAYLAGIELAAIEAKKQGVTIVYKTFFYGAKPLDILKKIPDVMEWKPDLILGPHYSNQFLLLKPYFSNTMVLSSYVTNPAIYELPRNFYSIYPPADGLIKGFTQFIHQRFPDRNMSMIVEADCKDCTNISHSMAKEFLQFNKKMIISKTEFIGNNLDMISMPRLTEKYEKRNLILLEPANYYLFETLMARIANFLDEPNLIFFSIMDSWNNAENTSRLLIEKSTKKYEAYRITLLLLDDSSDQKLKQFKQLYIKKHGKKPTDSVSYMNYLSVMSALSALENFPTNTPNLSMRERVLQSYKRALTFDPNWFRPRKYGIYHYIYDPDKKGESFVDVIPISGP